MNEKGSFKLRVIQTTNVVVLMLKSCDYVARFVSQICSRERKGAVAESAFCVDQQKCDSEVNHGNSTWK